LQVLIWERVEKRRRNAAEASDKLLIAKIECLRSRKGTIFLRQGNRNKTIGERPRGRGPVRITERFDYKSGQGERARSLSRNHGGISYNGQRADSKMSENQKHGRTGEQLWLLRVKFLYWAQDSAFSAPTGSPGGYRNRKNNRENEGGTLRRLQEDSVKKESYEKNAP